MSSAPHPAPVPTPATARPADCARHRGRRRRLGALALLTAGATLLGTGAFASWQATANASTATLRAATAGATVVGASGGQLTTPVSNLLPGDWLYRYVDVTNTSSVTGSFTGTVTASGLGSGLTVLVESCAAGWNTAAATCPGTPTTIATGSLSSPLSITHGTLAPTAVQHVRYKVTVDALAPSSLMGQSGALDLAVTSNLVGGYDRTSG